MRLEGAEGAGVVGIEIDMQTMRAQLQVMGGEIQDIGGLGLDRGDKAPSGLAHARRMRSGAPLCKRQVPRTFASSCPKYSGGVAPLARRGQRPLFITPQPRRHNRPWL